jgi:regulation of enolase protein 1 (concanavalin A-like superfamily)
MSQAVSALLQMERSKQAALLAVFHLGRKQQCNGAHAPMRWSAEPTLMFEGYGAPGRAVDKAALPLNRHVGIKEVLMRIIPFSIALLSICACAQGQDLGRAETHVTVSDVTFNVALNKAEKYMQVGDGKLVLSSPRKSDNFRDPDGKLSANSAPMLLTQIDNRKPFTFSAKVTPTFHDTYDAGALYLWVRDDLWLKMAMEQDERGHKRMVTVRTTGTSDDNNHDVVTAKSVFMKISSDTKTVAFYYSLDGNQWQLIRLFRNDYPAKLWLGVSAQSPVGDGNSVTFNALTLTPTSVTDFRLGT